MTRPSRRSRPRTSAASIPPSSYGPPDVDYIIDIVGRLGDAFVFADLEVQPVRAGDVTLTVVTPRTLHMMKRATVRPRDRDDAARLARAFDLGEG